MTQIFLKTNLSRYKITREPQHHLGHEASFASQRLSRDALYIKFGSYFHEKRKVLRLQRIEIQVSALIQICRFWRSGMFKFAVFIKGTYVACCLA